MCMKSIHVVLFFLFCSIYGQAQVGINTTSPDANSILHLKSTNKGLLIPRMTTVQREGMSDVKFSQGMMVYDITLDILFVGYGNGALSTKWYAMNPWKTEYRKGNNASKANMTTMTVNPSSLVGNSGVHYGNVGIGVLAPTEKLHVAGKVKATGFVGDATNATNLGGLKLHAARNNEANKVVRTDGNGYIQAGWINTTSGVASGKPTRIYCSQDSYLRYYTPASLAPYILNQGNTKNSHTHTYLPLSGGTLTGWLRTTGKVGWYSQTYGGGWHMTDSRWIRAYNGKGVYISGSASHKWKGYWFDEGAGGTGGMAYHNGYSDVGLLCAKGIVGDWVGGNSDERIKDIIGRSNSEEDLSNLLSIAVTDYKMKDKVEYGEKILKKVIAQQLKTLYPQAVSFITKAVPDIYKLSEIKDGYIALETDLEKDDRVKLIFEDKEEVVEVIKTDKKGFFIDNKKEGKVFVYGKEVNDFHVVDYDAVAMLNVSATQELHKIITSQQKIIQNLKNQLSSQGARLEETKINQSDFEARLKSLETEDSITTSNK